MVFSKATEPEEVVVRTLVGEYVEHGSNHGRKFFKKTPVPGQEAVDVFMYYWDNRDGPAFEGWWFGNQLGGTQVWSHCAGNSMTPPQNGWKIPWDGAVRPTLVVEKKGGGGGGCGGMAGPMAVSPAMRGAPVGGDVSMAATAAKQAIEEAKAMHENYTNFEGIQAAEEMLTPHLQALGEAMKKVMENQRGAQGEQARQFAQMGTLIRGTQGQLNTELAKLRASKQKADMARKSKLTEEKDAQTLAEVLPEATKKTNLAEDAVEKASITSEMIEAGGEDLDEVRTAVAQTEEAVQDAQKAIGEARIFLNAKQASCRRFESETVKQRAVTELGKLQQQLQAAANKLNPLKNVRQEFVQRTAAQKLVQETLEKLSPAEVDVDRAEEATMLMADSPSKESMTQADAAVTKASEHVTRVLKFIAEKKAAAPTGMPREELGKLEERAKASQGRLQELKNRHKEANEKVVCESLLKEAGDKLQMVAESITKAADAEAPFLMGVEELPLDETLTAVKGCEVAATAANTAVSIARMFIATKLVEAKRFSPGPSKEAQEKLKTYQGELEQHIKKLTELKKNTAARKKGATMKEAESEVNKAEELVREMGNIVAPLADDAKFFAMSSADIRAVTEEAARAEKAAKEALDTARKFVTARQIESKRKEMSTEVSAELIKYQTRLSAAQAEVGKHKKVSASMDSRMAAKKAVEEAQTRIAGVEEKVVKVGEACEALERGLEANDAEANKKATKVAESAAAEAQVSIKTATRSLENQKRLEGVSKEEIDKLHARLKQSQEKLDTTVAAMKQRSEKIIVDAIIKESDERVKDAEASVEKLNAAEEPFLRGVEEVPLEEAAKHIADLEAAATAANTAVSGAKTFLAMKRLAAKRLTEASAKVATEQLTAMQSRIDVAAKKTTEVKKAMAERKNVTLKREVEAKVSEMEKIVAEFVEATKSLVARASELTPEEMKAACEKAGMKEHKASASISETKSFLQSRQVEARTASVDSSLAEAIRALLERVQTQQTELDKHKTLLRDQEHRFVANRLLKDATDQIDKLEALLTTTSELAAPLTADDGGFTAGVFLSHAITALKTHMKEKGKTTQALFEEIGGGSSISEAKFIEFMEKLPELAEHKDMALSADQLKACFRRMDSKGGGEISAEDFGEQFRVRYLVAGVVAMTDTLVVKGSKTVRKLEVNEVVEQLEEPTKEPALGMLRIKARAEKDGKEGYLAMAGNQGTVYLVDYDPITALEKRADQALSELMDAGGRAQKYFESKIEELKAVSKGPLKETKTSLEGMLPKVKKVNQERKRLRTTISEAKRKQQDAMEEEKRKRQEAIDRQAADKILAEASSVVEQAEGECEKAVVAAQALVASKGSDQDDPLKAIDLAEKDLTTVSAATEAALTKIKELMETVKNAVKGPFSEARAQLVKHKVKVGNLDTKCKKQQTALASTRKEVSGEALKALRGVLAKHARAKRVSADDLFKELAGPDGTVIASSARKFIEAIPEHGLKAAQFDLGIDRLAAGLTKLTLMDMLQEYQVCIKDVSMTTVYEVKDSKAVRKLVVGEIVEVLEHKDDETAGAKSMARVRCRALQDGKEGWVTLKGNQGTSFLERAPKPYYVCQEDTQLQAAFESSSADASKVSAGEVLEVLEGPRQEAPMETLRVRGKAPKDGKSGWVTLKDLQGRESLELSKLLICKQSIAITTTFDITEGKALRKLDVGEALEIVEGPKEDPVRSLTRVKAKTKTDGKEGWVTLKGNQGTAYAEESDKHYVCKFAVPLEKRFTSGSETVRTLEEGEVFEVTEGPKPETKEGAKRVRGRNIADGVEGWFTLTSKTFEPWSPQYKCNQSTVINDGLAIKEAKAVRKLEVGEYVEALETPVFDKAAGLLRVRVRAEKDGAIGFATVRGNHGTTMLKPVTAGDRGSRSGGD